ncbi:DsbA family protein [Pontibacillus litoralis]|uniref:Thiol-disulfide oxidoreductase n=1 Tax=Pontibacillus litoralis JSM 072002 TaxID=1385512 RepID=A0A0A5G4V5_9BACI|nr:DsbA family protein [Pontibacillus litoralis]KGX87064.1 thiol-disulfide oxidoreductase [Pontibacillus litoralis JSM 072002]
MASKQQKGSNAWIYWMIAVVVAGAIIMVVLDNKMSGNDTNTEEAVTIDYENQPYIGDEEAPVSIIEFGDYLCPACKNFNEGAIPEIQQELIDSGQAKLYFMHFPVINNDSTKSATFAEVVYQELGNETFWEFHDELYSRQPNHDELEQTPYTDEFLQDTLTTVVDDQEKVEQVMTAYEESSDEIIASDIQLAKDLSVMSTPTMVVNGKVFKGESFEDLKQMVEEAANE